MKLIISSLIQRPFSRAIVVLSVACILVMNSFVYLVFQAFAKSLNEVQSARFITAYLSTDVQPVKEKEILSAILKIPEVRSAHLVSKYNFIENFSKHFPDLANELQEIDVDTIPRYIKIKVKNLDSESVPAHVRKLNGIDSVELNKQRFQGLIHLLVRLKSLALGLLFGMSIALLCVLLNHFKISSTFQTQVRTTLKLLGASRLQGIFPFISEGMLEGGLGGLVAALVILGLSQTFENHLNEIFSVMGYQPYRFDVTVLAVSLILIGLILGMIGSLWACVRVKG